MRLSYFRSLTILILSATAVFGCSLETRQNEESEPKAELQINDDPKALSILLYEEEQKPQTQLSEISELETKASIEKLDSYIEKKELDKVEFRDAWWHIRHGQQLDNSINSRIQTHINWFSKHQDYLDRVARRAQPYLYFIVEELKKENMPLEIALLPIVESGFQPFAYSHGRAAGMWQFIPSTGKLYGLKQDWWYDGRRDPYESTLAAIRLLKALHRSFDGDWLLALAAYNSGTGNVIRAVKKNKKKNKPTDFWHLELPVETENYVPKLLALKAIVNKPESYGLSLYPVSYQPHFERVDSGSQIDLAMVAELAEVPIETVYRYNSGFNRWATPPEGPHVITLPKESAKIYRERLANTPKTERITWKRHKVKSGETLSHIARKYHTTTAQIKQLNSIRKNNIVAGKYLIVPVSGKSLKTYSLSARQRLNSIQSRKRSGTKVVHTVKSGDTFWDLSRQYKVQTRSLAKWNGMAPGDSLKVGQKLVIWTQSSRALPKQNDMVFGRLKTTRTINYKVRSGDSLSYIASKFKVRVQDLKRWNKELNKRKYLQPGQKLKLKIDVRQQFGQS